MCIYIYIYICIYVFIISATVNIITYSFILYLVLLIGLRRYMLFQSFYYDLLFLKLKVCMLSLF